MKISVLTLVICFISTFILAQKKELSIEDAVIGKYTYLRPDNLQSLQWIDDQNYIFVNNDTLWRNNVNKDRQTVFLSLEDLNRMTAPCGTRFSYFPSFSVHGNGEIELQDLNKIFICNLKTKTVSLNLSVPEEADKPDICYSNGHLAYVKGQNLFILGKEGEKQITTETKQGIVCGQIVHRNEFGIEKGTFWSNTGKYLAFYRKDESMVKDYPLVDYMTREAEYTPVKYPMAGMTSHQVTVGIYNLETGKTIFLKTAGPDDHYLTNISWGPNDKYMYLAELNRDQDHMQLNQYSAETGEKIKTLFEETSKTYVEPLHPIRFLKEHPDQFFYWSRKDGWFHIYLYNTEGQLIRQITKGEWEVTDFYGTDPDEKNIFIQSTMESPVERQLYKVNISTGNIQKLSRTPGTHNALFSPEKTVMIDQWTASGVPSKTDLERTNGKYIRNIHTAGNPLENYDLGENKIIQVKAADGNTDLYCRMILPPGFDPSKKYPVIVYVYGGPHVQLVNDTWLNSADLWQYYMASKGYISFTMDSRGSDNRGKAFEEVIHRQLGINETADQMKGIEYLESLPYVDANRIGVHGWSFGGFMTLNLMLRHPEVFKVGVAGGPVVDWKMYEVMYGERYMDTPLENPEGYKNSNMINLVDRLNGKLMIIHGVQDETVVMQHSMMFLRECIKQNKQVDFFAYPTHPHNVRGRDRVHLMTKVSQYFFDYL